MTSQVRKKKVLAKDSKERKGKLDREDGRDQNIIEEIGERQEAELVSAFVINVTLPHDHEISSNRCSLLKLTTNIRISILMRRKQIHVGIE